MEIQNVFDPNKMYFPFFKKKLHWHLKKLIVLKLTIFSLTENQSYFKAEKCKVFVRKDQNS